MCLCVCMPVSLCPCVSVCLYAYIPVFLCASVFVCLFLCVSVSICLFPCVSMCLCLCLCVYVPEYVCLTFISINERSSPTARQNNQNFGSKEKEAAMLIYNHSPTYISQLYRSSFQQCYFFE